MKEAILSSIRSPKELEILYQQNPEEFQKAFPEAFDQKPDSLVLQVWHERISYIRAVKNQVGIDIWSYKSILLIVILTAIAGTILRLPQFIKSIDEGWFYSRNLAGIFIVPLMIYFFFQRIQSKRSIVIILGIVTIALLYLNILPNEYGSNSYDFFKKHRAFEDALSIAELHIPLFLWLLLGVAFVGKNWKDMSGRMSFLRYNGEIIIYTTVIVIGGLILTGITLALFGLIENSTELSDWYMNNIIPYGVVAAPIVATFLIEKVIGKRLNMAPILAKIFTPLFLLTTIAYLVLMTVYRNNPYNDREYLMAFNILLIVVLGLLIFSIAERETKSQIGISDYMNSGLIFVTVVIDIIAISAVIFRSTNDSYGFTPNRIAIIGINILVFCHLVGILYYYIRFMANKDSFEKVEYWVAKYLPIYAIWALATSITLPLIFWFK